MLGGGAALVGPKAKAAPGQLGVREKNAFARALRESPLQGSCDFGLIECISKWLETQRTAHTALDFVTFLLRGWEQGTGGFSA